MVDALCEVTVAPLLFILLRLALQVVFLQDLFVSQLLHLHLAERVHSYLIRAVSEDLLAAEHVRVGARANALVALLLLLGYLLMDNCWIIDDFHHVTSARLKAKLEVVGLAHRV